MGQQSGAVEGHRARQRGRTHETGDSRRRSGTVLDVAFGRLQRGNSARGLVLEAHWEGLCRTEGLVDAHTGTTPDGRQLYSTAHPIVCLSGRHVTFQFFSKAI